MTDTSTTIATTLGITTGHTVRLIGATSELEIALMPLPADVVVTSLASEPATVGIIAVEDENDLRERLFTELDGLLGATHVWVLAHPGGPDFDAISAEAKLVAWRAVAHEALPGDLTAVRIQKS